MINLKKAQLIRSRIYLIIILFLTTTFIYVVIELFFGFYRYFNFYRSTAVRFMVKDVCSYYADRGTFPESLDVSKSGIMIRYYINKMKNNHNFGGQSVFEYDAGKLNKIDIEHFSNKFINPSDIKRNTTKNDKEFALLASRPLNFAFFLTTTDCVKFNMATGGVGRYLVF